LGAVEGVAKVQQIIKKKAAGAKSAFEVEDTKE